MPQRSSTKTPKTSSSPSGSDISLRVAIDLAHKHGISKLDVRADGGFTIEFLASAHDKGGKPDIGTVGTEDEPRRVNKITGLPLSEQEMFGAGG
jgi:hypothetical protein